MSERTVLIQCVINQRTERPTGFRIWTDGLMQRCAADSPLPGPTERLDLDREVAWQDERHLNDEQVNAIRTAVQQAHFFEMPPRMLINYCKEDPGTAIWTVNVDGQTARVIVYDPRPRRSAELDTLSNQLANIVETL